METLEEMRKSIDNIDNAILAMLAERFKVTNQVGDYKAKHNLPAKDPAREATQYARIAELAEQYGLDPEFAKMYLSIVIDQVIARHDELARDFQQRQPTDR